ALRWAGAAAPRPGLVVCSAARAALLDTGRDTRPARRPGAHAAMADLRNRTAARVRGDGHELALAPPIGRRSRTVDRLRASALRITINTSYPPLCPAPSLLVWRRPGRRRSGRAEPRVTRVPLADRRAADVLCAAQIGGCRLRVAGRRSQSREPRTTERVSGRAAEQRTTRLSVLNSQFSILNS